MSGVTPKSATLTANRWLRSRLPRRSALSRRRQVSPIRNVMWGRNAEYAEKYIRKGAKLYIEGKIRTRVWEDKNAIKHNVTEIYVDTFDFLGQSNRQQ